MSRTPSKTALLFAGCLAALLLGSGCAPDHDLDSRLRQVSRQYDFSTSGWEASALWQEAGKILRTSRNNADETDKVTGYFSNVARINSLAAEVASRRDRGGADSGELEAELSRLRQENAAAAGDVEGILERQLREVLSQQGIFSPLGHRPGAGFPPVNFRMVESPHLLVVSPRERIESSREVLLRQDLSTAQMEAIEAEVDAAGVSSLVVELGGFAGVYPTLVTDSADLRFTIDTVAEEWVHQYLAFKPLGFLYILDLTGIARNYDIATMNETLASMVGKELGSILYRQYYGNTNGAARPESEPVFDFNRQMREVREAVDVYLAKGEVEQAEAFMEQQRQYLAANGYYIRKLNQAYFAFHGTYADSPTSISPIGSEMKELRRRSSSPQEFLDTVAAMTSRQQLADSLKNGE